MKSVNVFIATYNRAGILEETLEAMTRVDSDGIDVEWVIINNNCSDRTDEVVRSFEGRLPIRLVHEEAPGKNRALNRGIEEADERDIAVFADDDVVPARGWLREIVASTERWPEHDVFGGRIIPRWPRGGKPEWITQPWVLSVGFAWHDFGEEEIEYPESGFPFGPNFWVSGRLFREGVRYDESIGPVGKGRIMGSETSFLSALRKRGCGMVYCPAASVEHRIKEEDCEMATLERRMTSYGRGRARINGVNYRNMLVERPRQWWLRQRVKWVVAMLYLPVLKLAALAGIGRERLLWHRSTIGWILESFQIGRERVSGTGSK